MEDAAETSIFFPAKLIISMKYNTTPAKTVPLHCQLCGPPGSPDHSTHYSISYRRKQSFGCKPTLCVKMLNHTLLLCKWLHVLFTMLIWIVHSIQYGCTDQRHIRCQVEVRGSVYMYIWSQFSTNCFKFLLL